jgi:hypothetical protein
MKSISPRRRALTPHDDATWDSLVREASANLPEHLAPPLSSYQLPAEPQPSPTPAPPAGPIRAVASRKAKTTRYLNITRMDYPKSQGYFVRVRWKGDARSKLFSDGVYGDRLAALAAAIAWRDETTRELGKPRPGAAPSPGVGIHRRVREGREVYEATWSVGGKRGRTTYSIEKHGARQARALAIAARQRAMARLLEEQ